MDGNRLRRLRQERKLTQAELGKIINVSKVSISGYETGERIPDTDNLKRLADYFGVTTDYLLGRSNDPRLTADQDKEVDKKAEELMKIYENLSENKKKEIINLVKTYLKISEDRSDS